MKTTQYNEDYDIEITYSDWGYYTYICRHTGKEIKTPLWLKGDELLDYLRKNNQD